MSKKHPSNSATPYTSPLIFRTEVRPYLYLASAGLLVLGAFFVAFSLWGPSGQGFTGLLIAGVGVFMAYIAWVNFWVTRAGYPHLILHGHRLSVRSSDAFRRDLDLSALGDTAIKILTAPRSGDRLYLCFLPAPGAVHKPGRFTAPKLQPYAETILLNGYVGGLKGAKDIQQVIETRRTEPRQAIVLPPPPDRTLPRLRLIATATVFAALWVAVVWWRLLP